uniref:Uncharacterized protein n=1 Tax=Brassica oleracea TaxID=3712 RepID=A0A3P6FHQ9_BRAOL|nr:unnamed protein product [Brassica oleracea]
MVSASGGGLAYAFVSKGLKVKPAHALSWAVCFTLFASGNNVKETIRARSKHSTSTRGKAFDI